MLSYLYVYMNSCPCKNQKPVIVFKYIKIYGAGDIISASKGPYISVFFAPKRKII